MKITKGKWTKGRKSNNGCYQYINAPGWEEFARVVIKLIDGPDGYDLAPSKEGKNNVKLIIDAGNTYQECGMLPSELLKKLDRLEGNYEMLDKVRLEWVEKCNELQQANKELVKCLKEIKEEYISTKKITWKTQWDAETLLNKYR